jgi:GTP pyrophosphokinase
MRHLNESDSQLIIEALSITYIALREKNTAQLLEDSINRAAGIAAVLGELRADWSVVIAGILHEVITDVSASPEMLSQLTSRFGEDPIQLAVSYSKLPRFLAKRTRYTDVQGENQIQMLVMLAEDYRALYIRLADRLHTLRVLRKLPLDETHRLQIAREARYVYAPLAHKMGVMKVRDELEDLAFRVLEPDMFLMTRYTQTAAGKAYQDAAERIEQFIHTDSILLSKGAKLRVSYRIKSKYQIYLKMLRKGLKSPQQVRDALGLRLIVDAPREENESAEQYAARKSALCYYVVERLRHMPGWEPAREGFKDYVMNVKENGYQSLHQYIRHLALGTSVEVQVRTREMHYTAELGEAAHWCYKDKIYRPEVAHSKLYRLAWRSPQQLSARSAAELFGLAKKQLLDSRVYVYLHDMSTVLNLKKGSTALDAAFAIHTAMGLSAKEVQVNGIAADLGHVLHTGDVVSVQCEEVPAEQAVVSVHPNKLAQVRTRCALSALRRYFKEHNQTMLLCIGLVKLLHALELNAPRLGMLIRGASQLAAMVRVRANMPIHEYLVNLGSATAHEDNERLLVSFFQTSAAHLEFAPYDAALRWAAGGGLASHEEDVVRPLLREILPESMSVESHAESRAEIARELEKCWSEVIREGLTQTQAAGPHEAIGADTAGCKAPRATLRKPYSLQAPSRSRPSYRNMIEREQSAHSGSTASVGA